MSDLLNQASLVMVPSGYKEDTVYSVVPSDGSGDLSFTRASNGTRINSAGLVEVVAWNLAEYSEDFSNAVWTKARVTITANDTTAPNGTATADKVSLNSGTNSKLIQQAYSQNGAFTQTVYAKAGTHNFMQLLVGSDATPYCNFDLVNGTYSASGCTASITSVGNGWFYLTMSYSTTIGTDYYLWVVDSLSSARADSTSSTGYYYVWGFQLNIGSTAKPYFPTTDRLNVPRLTYQNGGGGCPSLLLEKQSTNLALYSEQFDNAAWTAINGATITANSVISPDGTQNADTLNVTTTAYSSVYNTTAYSLSTGLYAQSIYAKKGTKNWLYILDLGGSGAKAWFNLDTGVVGTVASGYTATMENVGNGWYRCILIETANRSPLYFHFGASDADNSFTPSSSGSIFIWGAQLEASSYPTSYIPTTSSSATRVADACSKTGISSLIGQTSGTMFVDTYVGNETDEVYGWLQASLSGNPNDSIQINRAGTSVQCQIYVGSGIQGFISGGTIAKGQRIKVAVGYKQNDVVLYLNGTQIGVDTSTNIPTCAVFQLGAYPPLPNDYTNDGGINQAILFPTRLTNAELASLTTI
jgi:hypothetical protein